MRTPAPMRLTWILAWLAVASLPMLSDARAQEATGSGIMAWGEDEAQTVEPPSETVSATAYSNAVAYTEDGWQGSMMFPSRDMQALHEARQTYEDYLKQLESQGVRIDPDNPPEDFLSTLIQRERQGGVHGEDGTDSGDQILVKRVPTLYLESITRLSDREWVVHINGRRYSPETRTEDFEIMAVADDYVEIAIPYSASEMLPMRLTDRTTPIEKRRTLERRPAFISGIYLDRANRRVVFRLRPNQTFSARTVEIIEGRGLATNAPSAAAEGHNRPFEESLFLPPAVPPETPEIPGRNR